MNELQDYIDYLEYRLEQLDHGSLEFLEVEEQLEEAEYQLAEEVSCG